jgi:hypothetical protein
MSPPTDPAGVVSALEYAEDWITQAVAKHPAVNPDRLAGLHEYYRRRRESAAGDAKQGRPLPEELAFLAPGRCALCESDLAAGEAHCTACGAAVQSPAGTLYRNLTFLLRELRDHGEAGRLPLFLAHALLTRARGERAAARARLGREAAPVAVPVVEPVDARPARRRRSVMELVLDPRGTQCLLAVGGTLFVLGLVVWLAARGVFENPAVVAAALGAANLAALAGGWAVTRRSRYQTAGRALALLACLVLPLNLWFYHAQGLVTVEGHLWLAALAVCLLYAASARVLRDALFVPVFLGGVALAGLLLLGELGQFWEIAAPVGLLAGLGLLAVHAERAFPPAGEGPFTRRRFGLAFFWTGHALLAAGLLLLLGAQLAGGWLYDPVFRPVYEGLRARPSPVVAEPAGRVFALAVVLAAACAYAYSDLVVRRIGLYLYLAAGAALWAEVLAVELLAVHVGPEVVIAVLALTALAVNLLHTRAAGSDGERLVRSFPVLGLFLTLLPVVWGVVLHARATSALGHAWPYPEGWGFVGAMLLTAAAARAGAFLYRHARPGLSAAYFFATGAATLVAAAGLLGLLGRHAWQEQAPWLMALPLAYLLAAKRYRGGTAALPLYWVGQAATAVMLLSSLGAAFQGFFLIRGEPLNLALALFFAEAAGFYALAVAVRGRGANVYLGTAAAAAAVWQLLSFAGAGTDYYAPTFASLGVALLVVYRFAVPGRLDRAGVAPAAFQCGNALLSLGFLAELLSLLGRLAGGAVHRQHDWAVLVPLLALLAATLVGAALVGHAGWRRWYLAAAVAQGLLTALVVNALIDLSPWQSLEVFTVAVGLGLLAAGHAGWYREQGGERRSDLVDFALVVGSLLVGIVLGLAVSVHRFRDTFSLPDEVGLLAAGLLLLASGLVLRLRATTVTGGGMVLLYVVGLLLFVHWRELSTAALVLAGGGGVLFGTGLVLSVFRERLRALPDRLRRREGLFKVLDWR